MANYFRNEKVQIYLIKTILNKKSLARNFKFIKTRFDKKFICRPFLTKFLHK